MLDANRKRILIYSHDTYGLGHLRRSLLIAGNLVRAKEAPLVLIVTGSPRAQAFRMPEGVDCMKLPAITKDPAGSYRPRTLGISMSEILHLRSEILRGAVKGFAPDAILVDHAPVGVEGELIPVFKDLERLENRPKVILGLRDVIDDVSRVEAEWDRLGVRSVLDSVYDRILVYGDSEVTTTAHELGLPAWYAGKVSFTGYLGRDLPAHNGKNGAGEKPQILVTVGGGGDGQKVLRGYARFLQGLPNPAAFRSRVVMGPFLSGRRQSEIASRFNELDHEVELIGFTNEMERCLQEATAVIAMGGYNSVMEILAAGLPALVVPREFPRREQRLRAERISPHANMQVALADKDLPDHMARFVDEAMQQPDRVQTRLRLDGLKTVTSEIMGLIRNQEDGSNQGSGNRRRAITRTDKHVRTR